MNKKLMLFVVAIALATASPLAAQTHHHYKLIDVGTFGGPGSFGADPPAPRPLNNLGIVVGGADTATPDANFPNLCLYCGPNIFHAFQFHNGVQADLGALPGANSSLASWVSDNGLIVGWSENGAIDPLLGAPELEAVLWKSGQIIGLGTLGGGYESVALAVNNRGEVVGVSSNLVPDVFGPLGTQNRVFLWKDGSMKDLGTLGGPDAGFLGLVGGVEINEAGQVVACSYTNSTANPVTGTPTLDPFLWQNGTMHDLGNLGGTSACATFINNYGQVGGYSTLAGDLEFHPFLWDRGTLKDLGTFGGDNGLALWVNDAGHTVGRADITAVCAECAPGNQRQLHHPFLWINGALTDLGVVDSDTGGTGFSINSRDQVVGISVRCMQINPDDSCDGTVMHGFLWEAGSIVDLQRLIVTNSEITVNTASDINERGEIFGSGVLPDGDTHLVLLIPCDEYHPNIEGCNYSLVAARSAEHGETQTVAKPALASDRIHRSRHSAALRSTPEAQVSK